jgi:hypothetical protein
MGAKSLVGIATMASAAPMTGQPFLLARTLHRIEQAGAVDGLSIKSTIRNAIGPSRTTVDMRKQCRFVLAKRMTMFSIQGSN